MISSQLFHANDNYSSDLCFGHIRVEYVHTFDWSFIILLSGLCIHCVTRRSSIIQSCFKHLIIFVKCKVKHTIFLLNFAIILEFCVFILGKLSSVLHVLACICAFARELIIFIYYNFHSILVINLHHAIKWFLIN